MSVRRISISSDRSATSASAVETISPVSPPKRIKLKIVYGNDIRLHKISLGNIEAGWQSIQTFASGIFRLSRTSLMLQYVDDEGDKITITTATDLQEAIDLTEQQGKTLKLFVAVSSAPVIIPQSATIPASAVLAAVQSSQATQDDPTRLRDARRVLSGTGSRPARPMPTPSGGDLLSQMASDAAFQREVSQCIQEIVENSQRGRNLNEVVNEALRTRPRLRDHPQIMDLLYILPGVKDEIQPAISSLDPNSVPAILNQVVNTTKSVGSSFVGLMDSMFTPEEKKPEPTDMTVESIKLLGAIARPIVVASVKAVGHVAKAGATTAGRAAVSAASNMLSSAASALDGDGNETATPTGGAQMTQQGCDVCGGGHGHGHAHHSHNGHGHGMGHGHSFNHGHGYHHQSAHQQPHCVQCEQQQHHHYHQQQQQPQHYRQAQPPAPNPATFGPRTASQSMPSFDTDQMMAQLSALSNRTVELSSRVAQSATTEIQNLMNDESLTGRPRSHSASAVRPLHGVVGIPVRRKSHTGSSPVIGDQQQAPPPPVAKPKPIPLPYKAELVEENCGRGFGVQPGETFKKLWVVSNNGDVAWPAGLRFCHSAGRKPDPLLQDVTEVNLPELEPGEQVAVAIELIGPSSRGLYSSPWKLTAADGRTFGPVFRARVTVV